MTSDTSGIIDPFHKAVHRVIYDEIQNRVEGVATGQVNNFEDYKEKVGYIRALSDVIERCKEIEVGMYGSKA